MVGQGWKAPVVKFWNVWKEGPKFEFGILEEGSSVGIVKEWLDVDVVDVAAGQRLIMNCVTGMGYWCGMDDVLDHVMMTF